ncbi:MAG: hypothetical protein QFB86_03200 [Patescibacteria group bacterium]|nr:hypothetical protein [Patescibacteria group bacterium]
MIQNNERGAVSGVAISLVLTVLLLVGAIGFAAWAFTSRQDYKSNTDEKISKAVTIAKQEESSAKDKQFIEDEKQPLRAYKGPEAYGSIALSYPKTWSGYVDDSGKAATVIDGFFSPNIVPSTADPANVFALRLQVVDQPYSQVAKNLAQSLESSSDGPAPNITAYSLPKMPKVVGIKIIGTLPNQKQGVMVVLPLRSQTIQIWSETGQFTPDFENSILPNLSYSP